MRQALVKPKLPFSRNLLTSCDFEEMYLGLDNIDNNNEIMENFNLQQVENEEMMNTWCEVLCKGYEVSEEHREYVKKQLLALYDNDSYRLFIGYENDKAVSSSALHKIHKRVDGLYMVTTIPSCRNKHAGYSTVMETLKSAKGNKSDLIILQASKEQMEFFKKLGFVTTFDKEI